MTGVKTRLAEAALTFVLGAGFAIGVGLLIFGVQIFEIDGRTFAFVSEGIAASAAFAVYRLSNIRVAVVAAVVFAVILGLLARGNFVTVSIDSVVFLLVVTVLSKPLWGGEGGGFFIFKLLYICVALGIVGTIVSVILAYFTGGLLSEAAIFNNVILAVLVGVGLAFGFEIASLIGRVIRHAEKAD